MSADLKSITVRAQVNRWLPRVLFVVSLCIFIVAVLENLGDCFPCESQDEESKFRIALRFMQVFFGHKDLGELFGMYAHERSPFLMFNDYVGWPVLYFAVVLMSVLGNTLGYFFVFSFACVPFGVLTLISIWFVLRRWFDEWTAALTVFFVGSNYSYIQSVQHGFYREEILQVCGLWLGLALCLMSRTRKWVLYLGFFVFGLALWTKIMFAAYIIAAAVTFLVLGHKSRGFIKDWFSVRRHVFRAGLAFICGASPLVWFNLRNGFPTFRLISLRLFRFSEVHADWNNSAVHKNLLHRLHDLYLYLSKEVLFGVCGDLFKITCLALFICAFVWGCAVVFGRRGDGALKLRLRCLFVFYFVVLVLSCFVPNRHHPGHILVLVPFPSILCALFLVHIGRLRGLLFVPVLVCGLWFNEQIEHFRLFSQNCVHDGQVCGLRRGDYDFLLAWLKSRDIKSILCTDPLGSLLYIMGNEGNMEIYDLVTGSAYSSDSMAVQLGAQVSDTPVYWLFNCDNYADYARIKDSAEKYGIKITILDIKTLKRGATYTFLLCRVSRIDKNKNMLVLRL